MHITILSASPRQNSASIRVARAIQGLLSGETHGTEIIDFRENDIPGVGRGSLQPGQLTVFQTKWVNALSTAQLIICVVPEYNWIMPGEWIDAWHQTGNDTFSELFEGKVFAVTGVSSGRGGRRPALETQQLLNKLISFLGKTSVVSPALFESHETESNVNPDGELVGADVYRKGLERFLRLSLNTAMRWHRA